MRRAAAGIPEAPLPAGVSEDGPLPPVAARSAPRSEANRALKYASQSHRTSFTRIRVGLRASLVNNAIADPTVIHLDT